MGYDRLAEGMNQYLPLRDVVFNTLRQAIISGEFAPGERLMEIALAKRLGVSRTPVREAIHKLELEGLVTMVPRKGAQVARITDKSFEEVMEVCGALEEFAVSLACDRIDEKGLKDLSSLLESFTKSVESDDLSQIVDNYEHFYEAVFRAAGNERLYSIIEGLREQFYLYRMRYIRDMEDRNPLLNEQSRLLEALSRQDKTTASQISQARIQDQKKQIFQMLT